MKVGNIKEIVKSCAEKYKSFRLKDKDYDDEISFEIEIKKLPKNNLEKWFQERYNKNLDYDQWVGIRDELDRMGRKLYENTLSIIGDSVLIIQKENQVKIERLEEELGEKNTELDKLKNELRKYID